MQASMERREGHPECWSGPKSSGSCLAALEDTGPKKGHPWGFSFLASTGKETRSQNVGLPFPE